MSVRWLWLIIPFSLVPMLWYWLFVNPLPSDEELIAHFNAHRTEFEELVKRYREYERPIKGVHEWGQLPEIQALEHKAGVWRLSEAGSAWWLPNPYAADMPERVKAFQSAARKRYFWVKRRYAAIEIWLSDQRYGVRSAIVAGSYAVAIWKNIVFFPEIPKIENGLLWEPAGPDGRSHFQWRVFASLDGYPPDWKKGECGMRPIEARWYIVMCWGAN